MLRNLSTAGDVVVVHCTFTNTTGRVLNVDHTQ
jgi:hypothetical protein